MLYNCFYFNFLLSDTELSKVLPRRAFLDDVPTYNNPSELIFYLTSIDRFIYLSCKFEGVEFTELELSINCTF